LKVKTGNVMMWKSVLNKEKSISRVDYQSC